MIGVVVHYNDSSLLHSLLQGNFLLKRWLSFYVFSMQAFGATDLIMIGGPEISHGYAINFKRYDRIEDALSDYQKHKIVTLVGEGGEPLDSFKHPKKDVLYVVGDDYGDVELDKMPTAKKVTIENPGNVAHLWGHNAIAIALYDRRVKHGGN